MSDTKEPFNRDTFVRQICARHDDDTLTVEEVAIWLNKRREWVIDHASGRRKPAIPSQKMGKRFDFRWGTLKAWRKSLERPADAPNLRR